MTMTNTKELLTLLKARHGGVSDYRISKILGVTHQAVSKWNCGKSTFNDEIAVKVAYMLDLDPDYILISIYAERCTRDDISQVLIHAAERLRPNDLPVTLGIQKDLFKIA